MDKLLAIKAYLVRAARSPFVKQTRPFQAAGGVDYELAYVGTVNPPSSASNSLAGNKIDVVNEVVGDLVNAVCDTVNARSASKVRKQLIEMCLDAIKLCLTRFGAHYKSLYRLAYYHYTNADIRSAFSVLVGSFASSTKLSLNFQSSLSPGAGSSTQQVASSSSGQTMASGSGSSAVAMAVKTGASTSLIPGLFADRKNNNLFNGIWRVPVDDIDRPGSFSSHMYRSTLLLIRVCTAMFNYQECEYIVLSTLFDDDSKLVP